MSIDDYCGPVIGVLEPPEEVMWQYGYRQPDGSVLRLQRRPRAGLLPLQGVVRRRIVAVGSWGLVPVGEDSD